MSAFAVWMVLLIPANVLVWGLFFWKLQNRGR